MCGWQCKVEDITGTVTAVSQTEAAGGVKKNSRTEAAALSSTVDGSVVAEITTASIFLNRAFEEEGNAKEKKVCLVLTQRDVLKHNATVPKEGRWIPRGGYVYDYGKFRHFLLTGASAGRLKTEKQLQVLNFKYLNRQAGINLSLIEKAKTLSCVGCYQVPTASELRDVYRQQLLSTREELTAPPPRHNTPSFVLIKTTSFLQENSFTHCFVYCQKEPQAPEERDTLMAEICTQALMKLDIMYLGTSSSLTIPKFCPGIDPSLVMFPVPWGVEPEELRSWLTTWQTFDLEVDADGAWPMLADNVMGDSTVPSPSTLRPWLDGRQTFDTTITGEAAWEVAALEIVKDDVATEKQLAVWERRNAVSDFHRKARMAKIRQRMVERYFAGCLQMFDKFSERMERNLEELEELLQRHEIKKC